MEIGVYTFGDLVADPHTGRTVSGEARMRQMLDLARHADEAGLDVVGVGEHHGLGFVNSATATTLAAMAAVTERVRLTSASTLLSTADPVRTFQEFATADLVSGGRVELVVGRGAFTDNFPLFGFRLDDYDALFVEKLGLFAALNARERVTWTGRFRPPLHDAEIAPRPVQPRLPVWIGAGSPGSVARAAHLGYPLALPVLGGSIPGYGRIAALYREAWAESGRTPEDARIAVYSHAHVAETAEAVRRDFFPYYSAYLRPMFGGPMPVETFAHMLSPEGTLLAGTPGEVADKLLALHDAVGFDRYVAQVDVGGLPPDAVARSLALLADEVAPVLRAHAAPTGRQPADA